MESKEEKGMGGKRMIKDILASALNMLIHKKRVQSPKTAGLFLLKARNRALAEVQERRQTAYNQAMPIHLTIETTMKCNLRCIMCQCTHNVRNPMAQPSMDIALFQKIAEEVFPTLEEVSLTVSGEPLLSEHLDEYIETIKKYAVKLEMNTNATLLNNDEMIDKLLGVLTRISVSFDGATKDTYEAIRRGAKYEKVIANIRRFNELRNSLPEEDRPGMSMTYVLMRRNIAEFPRFIELAKALGADAISAVHVVVFDQAMTDESLIYHKELANKYLIEAREIAGKLGFKGIHLPPLFDVSHEAKNTSDELATSERHQTQAKGMKRVVRCPFLWKKSYVSFGGDVSPCCVPGRPVMGNVVNRSFKEIWNGEVYQEMRRRLNSNNPFECCQHCNQLEETVIRADEEAFIQF